MTPTERDDEMKNAAALDVVFIGGPVVGELTAAKDEALLLGVNAGLFLDALLDTPDCVGWVDVDFGLIAGEEFDFD